MKVIKLYEEFTNKTLTINRDEYDLYFNGYKDSDDKSKMLMWMAEGSQEQNFEIVSRYIKSNNSLLDYGCGTGDFITYLNSRDIIVSDYFGVDINKNFIDTAIKTHDGYKYEMISDIDDVYGNWDIVASIGVFTWYIERDEFIRTIRRLYDLAIKEVLITCNRGYFEDNDEYWGKEYRFYNEDTFIKLFPGLDISFDYIKTPGNELMLVRIKK